tara:strand:- start:866 stop:1450 length:585 start_codon:yes stop_codon:yes gene_type:complete
LSKPNKTKASEQEKALASVSLAEKNYFREKYLPKLKELRDRSSTENYQGVATGRAQADTMQALSRPSLQATQAVDTAANMASAAGAQALQGRSQGLTAQRGDQVNVLKNARGMQADAQQGLSRAARIESTKQLQFARAKQARRNANVGAFQNVAVSGIKKVQDLGGFGKVFGQEEQDPNAPQDPDKPVGSFYGY